MTKSRFNLLVISDDAKLSQKALKAVSKSYRRNFIFEVENRLEAQKVLERLHIDMVLVDLDFHRVKLADFASKNPDVPMVAVSSRMAALDIHPGETLVLDRRDFAAQLMLEIKEMKKGGRAVKEDPRPARSTFATPSFDNYAMLVGA